MVKGKITQAYHFFHQFKVSPHLNLKIQAKYQKITPKLKLTNFFIFSIYFAQVYLNSIYQILIPQRHLYTLKFKLSHLKQSMKNKENRVDVITPKKQSKINNVQLSTLKGNDTTNTKDFLSPFLQNMLNGLPISTPLKQQPQFLFSPSPVKKDLFSQLLGSQVKNNSPSGNHSFYQNAMIMEEDDNECMDDESMRSNSQDNSEMSDSENDGFWEDENGVKKRKRKSTVQIKMLKQELQGEMNWTKQKITRMAEITGLSQSQVYKWCWDQKKKNMKYKDSQKRKMIKKQQGFKGEFDEKCEQKDQFSKVKYAGEYQFMESRTKPKAGAVIDESGVNTEKKINKKLVFY